jgi:hypothetical protein
MIYKRIFIFGCSFTKHQWPTWADVIRYNADIPVENWGHGGIGNVGILHKLFECDLKNRFTQEDLILIQWSGWSREDRFRERWIANGNIFTSYDKNFIKNHWHRNNDVIKNSTALMIASRLFNIGYQCHLIPLGTPECDTNMPNQNNEIYDFYMNQLDTEDDIFPLAFNSQFDNRCMDTHPDIKNHIHFYENYVRKKLNFLPEIKNKNELLDLHDTISKSINKTMSFQKTMEIVTAITEQFDKTLVEKPLGF